MSSVSFAAAPPLGGHRSVGSLQRLVAFVAAVVVMVAFVGVAPVGAQSNDDVADIARALADDGVYIQSGVLSSAEGSESELRGVVESASRSGVQLAIVGLSSDWDGEALARSLSASNGGTVLVITPDEIAAWSADREGSGVNRALDASFNLFNVDLTEGAQAFADELATTASSSGSTASSSNSSGGGGGSGFLIFLLIVVVAVVALVVIQRIRNRKKVRSEMDVRREAVSTELAELGSEIYQLSDRVTVGDDAEATKHFREGNEQYLQLQKDLENASTLWEITKIDYAADTAAWHLDAAEAILEGEDIPDEPDRPDLRVSRPPAPDARSDTSADQPPPPPSRRVEPRQRRRTQWDPPRTRGGGLGDLITGVLVGEVLRGGGRSGGRRRAPRGWSGGGSLGGGFGGSRSRGGFGGGGSRSRGGGGSRRR